MKSLQYRSDSERIIDRFETWWKVSNPTPILTGGVGWTAGLGGKAYPDDRSRWMDFEDRISAAEATFAQMPAFGENLPIFWPNLGPDITSVLYGTEIEFAPDTSWVHPIVETLEDLLKLQPSFEHPLWKAMEELQRQSLERGRGKWITGFTDLHPNADLLVSLIGPETLCMELADDLDAFDAALRRVTPVCIEAYERQVAPLLAEGLPTLSWLGCPTRGRGYIASCDFSCLVSPAIFNEFILPRIVDECRNMDRVIYHLDGPDALRHLDALLATPEIDAIQWVFGAGNHPARRWTEVYQRIQAAGKALVITCCDLEDGLELSRALRPEGVWMEIPWFSTLGEAEAYRRELEANFQTVHA